MKVNIIHKTLSFVLAGSLFFACTIEEPTDVNRPSLEGIGQNATIPQLNNAVVGTMAQMRGSLEHYYDGVGVIGREHYRFSNSDPRYTSDLPGGTLDNNAFYTTLPYSGRYSTIKNCNIILEALENTTFPIETEKEGYRAFAKTIKAYELLLALNMQEEGGIRVDVNDPDNLGPFLPKTQALDAIRDLLNEAFVHASNAGDEFPFTLTSGFEAFSTPATFNEFNRALAARVAIYQEDWAGALDLLGDSFFDLAGDLNLGAYHVYSTGSGDTRNIIFLAPNASGDIRAAHPSFIADAEAGDSRLDKVFLRDAPAAQSGLTSDYDVYRYKSNVDNVPIIRNEELILIYAEANIHEGNYTEAADALDIIRNAANLPNYSGTEDLGPLLDEMLNQRRYSLYFEGHRWIDMRRYDRLDELPIDRATDRVHVSFPRPLSEVNVQGG